MYTIETGVRIPTSTKGAGMVKNKKNQDIFDVIDSMRKSESILITSVLEKSRFYCNSTAVSKKSGGRKKFTIRTVYAMGDEKMWRIWRVI
jgi:hypothetical protein